MGGGIETFQIIGVIFILIVLVPFAFLLTNFIIRQVTEDKVTLIPDDPKAPEDVGVFQFFRDLLFTRDEER